jgi:hypothetical protein
VPAAKPRYTSATKWNDGDAWLHLGEVKERLKSKEEAKVAYRNKLPPVQPDVLSPMLRLARRRSGKCPIRSGPVVAYPESGPREVGCGRFSRRR